MAQRKRRSLCKKTLAVVHSLCKSPLLLRTKRRAPVAQIVRRLASLSSPAALVRSPPTVAASSPPSTRRSVAQIASARRGHGVPAGSAQDPQQQPRATGDHPLREGQHGDGRPAAKAIGGAEAGRAHETATARAEHVRAGV
jgi:hypothetical protein